MRSSKSAHVDSVVVPWTVSRLATPASMGMGKRRARARWAWPMGRRGGRSKHVEHEAGINNVEREQQQVRYGMVANGLPTECIGLEMGHSRNANEVFVC